MQKVFESVYKNGKTIIRLSNNEIEKQKFHQHESPVSIKIQIIIKQQYLIRFLPVKKDLNISLATKMLKMLDFFCIFLPKMRAYRTNFDKTKYISILIKDNKLL